MTPWTDEHVGALLTAAFVSHEEDADPAVAQRIALTTPPAPRRAWPVVAAALATAALLVTVGVQALRPDEPSPRPAPPSPAQEGHNRMVATAAAARLLEGVPLPPGAAPEGTVPPAGLRLRAQIGAVDASLTQTAWWIVPMSRGAVAEWYGARLPADANADGDLTWWTEPGGSAYTAPTVIVTYGRAGPARTQLRIDVTIAARDDRTAATFVPADVSSVDVTRSDITSPVAPPTTITVTVPSRVRLVVDAFNGLVGAPAGVLPMACASPTGDVRLYAVTFHWPGRRCRPAAVRRRPEPHAGRRRAAAAARGRRRAERRPGGGVRRCRGEGALESES